MSQALTIPTSSKEAFAEAVKCLTPKWMAKNLSVSLTHIYRMAADKNLNGESRRDLIRPVEIILEGLVKTGCKELAIVIVDRMARIVGAELAFRDHTPDRESVIEEFVDDNTALSHYHQTVALYRKDQVSVEELRYAKKNLHREIDQTFAKTTGALAGQEIANQKPHKRH